MKTAIAFAVSFLLLINLASAISFDKVYVELEIKDSVAYEQITASLFTEKQLNSIVFPLSVKPENLEISLPYQLKEDGIVINKTIPANSSFEFSMKLQTSSFITKISESEFLFSYTSPRITAKEMKVKVALPEETRIVDKGSLLVSRPVFISTDGRRIFLEWIKELSEEEFTSFVQYNKAKTEYPNIFLIVSIVLAAGFIIGYKLKKVKKAKIIKEVLSEDERIIVDEISKRGEAMQDELRKTTNFSKTKVSKILRNLEMKGIVLKTPYKKTNKIKLK